MHKTLLSGLYTVTDRQLMGDALLDEAALAIAGGINLLQYRDKTSDTRRRRHEALQLRELCRQNQVIFIINDDVELAQSIDADGVHIGQQDRPLRAARDQLGQDKLIGVSCNNRLDLALQAEQEGTDYIAFGRFFPSLTKPEAPQADIALLRQAKRQLHVPIVAIGGISLNNAPQLIEAGADMLAVIHAIFGQEDIQQAANCFTKFFEHQEAPATSL